MFTQSTLCSYLRKAVAVTLIYDITNYGSFTGIKERYENTISKWICPNAVYMLVGNKCDREDRKVPKTEGEHYAGKEVVCITQRSNDQNFKIYS